MTDSDATLLPCPFCGGDADVQIVDRAKVLNVGCPDCNIRTMFVVADEIGLSEAIKDWNTRVEHGEGENLSSTNYFHCSECLKKTYKSEDEFNFCPNCGRKVAR